MSMGYWPQQVAHILNREMGFEHPLLDMPHTEIGRYLKNAMQNVPLENFLP
jgi:hypothetical protein